MGRFLCGWRVGGVYLGFGGVRGRGAEFLGWVWVGWGGVGGEGVGGGGCWRVGGPRPWGVVGWRWFWGMLGEWGGGGGCGSLAGGGFWVGVGGVFLWRRVLCVGTRVGICEGIVVLVNLIGGGLDVCSSMVGGAVLGFGGDGRAVNGFGGGFGVLRGLWCVVGW